LVQSPCSGYQGVWNAFVAQFGVSDGNLGLFARSWGVEIDTNEVWAITDHQGEFAVVPEPSTLALTAVGAIGICWIACRQRRRGTS